jgi:hypothetical protein
LGVGIDQYANVILIALRGGKGDDMAVKVQSGLRTHAAENTDDTIVHISMP